MNDFDFDWKFKDFEIRTSHTYGEKEEPYVELIKWEEENGRRYCFTLAYWEYDKDGYSSLVFVGERPLEYIAEIDVSVIWKQLFLAQQMFADAMKRIDNEKFE